MPWTQGSYLHKGSVFLFRRAVSRLDIPRDDVSTTCVYLMRRSHHGPLRRRGNVSSWLISKVDYFHPSLQCISLVPNDFKPLRLRSS